MNRPMALAVHVWGHSVQGVLEAHDMCRVARMSLLIAASIAPCTVSFGDEHSSRNLGRAVCAMGDVNADGTCDFAIGSPFGLEGVDGNPGEVALVSGQKNAVLWRRSGSSQERGYGRVLSNVGDLDGDGCQDVAVSFEAVPGPSGRGTIGGVQVLSGKTGRVLSEVHGNVEENFGAAVCGTGDVTGDGIPDYAVSAPLARGNGVRSAGRVILIDGKSGRIVWERTGGARSGGNVRGECLGAAVVVASDVKSQVCDSLVVLAPGPVGGEGRVIQLSAQTGDVMADVSARTLGVATCSVSRGGHDLNGDGIVDLVLGEPGYSEGGEADAGVVIVVLGSIIHGEPKVAWKATGSGAMARKGASIAIIEKKGVDGQRPFAVVATDCGNGGHLVGHDPRSGKELWRALGEWGDGGLLSCCCSVPDIDGDGVEEVLVGAWSGRNVAEVGVIVSGSNGKTLNRIVEVK